MIEEKKCTNCKEVKPVSEFSKNKTTKSGFHSQCKGCNKICNKPKSKEAANRDAKNYALRHPDRVKKTWATYYEKNKEKLVERKREYDKVGKSIESNKAYIERNRDNINARRRERKKNMSVEQKLEKNVRSRFYKVIIKMKKGIKYTSSLNLIGCSIEELKSHLEKQFVDGMTWDNHGNGDGNWNIDHIIPLVTFDLSTLEEQEKAFHYTNLRPLWFLDNMRRPRKLFEREVV